MQVIDSAFADKKIHLNSIKSGSLDHMTFSVKDVFQIKGYVTGLGNPSWKAEKKPAAKNALVVNKLLKSGAVMNGITVSDEFMFSIKGSNQYYGDPLNPRHPECYTGGSSSGSASVVAQHLADFALGTDTGGSVRVPASYCGLFGFRPTHSLDALTGVAPLATSFDTVGLLAHEASALKKAGQVIYQGSKKLNVKKIYYLVDPVVVQKMSYDYLVQVQSIASSVGVSADRIKPLVFKKNLSLSNLQQLFKDIQGFEAWGNYGSWISKNINLVGQDIAEHFKYAASINKNEELAKKYEQKNEFSIFLNDLLKDALLILPTTSSTAPQKNLPFEIVEQIRSKTQQLTSIAGLAGVPQLVLPLKTAEADFSLSIISEADTDTSLLNLTDKIFKKINYGS